MQAHTSPNDDALYRKIAWRIIPFLFICYIINFIDRVNIGFAKLQFLQDLNLNDAAYGLAAGLFFVGYALFEVPSNLLLARIGTRKTLLRIMLLWGTFTVLQMFVQNAIMLYILRFLLGTAEAGFFPGIILYLTYWFPDSRLARVNSVLMLAVPIAGIIGGPLAGWIMSHFHDYLGLRGWQWLFLVEGVPAIVLGMLVLVFLCDRPELARWLTNSEKAHVSAALATTRQNRGEHPQSSARLRDILSNPRIALLSAIYFCIYLGMGAITFWIPTILRHVGVSHITDIGWVVSVISICTMIGNLAIGFSSDRRMERRWHIAGCGFTAAASLLLLPLASNNPLLTVVMLTVAQTCMFTVPIIFWTIPAACLESHTRAGGIALISSVGSIGGLVSSWLVGTITAHAGTPYIGIALIAVMLAIGMIMLLVYLPTSGSIIYQQSQLAKHGQTIG